MSVLAGWWMGWLHRTQALFSAHFGVSSSLTIALVVGGRGSWVSIALVSPTSKVVVVCGKESETSTTGLQVIKLGVEELLVSVGGVEVVGGVKFAVYEVL